MNKLARPLRESIGGGGTSLVANGACGTATEPARAPIAAAVDGEAMGRVAGRAPG